MVPRGRALLTTEGIVTDIGHIIVPVKDMDRAIAFYRDLLGFQVVGAPNPAWTVVAVPGGHLTLFRTDAIPTVALGPDGGGTPFRLHVRDFSLAAERLESKGVRVKRDGPNSGVVWDPSGNAVGLHDHRDED